MAFDQNSIPMDLRPLNIARPPVVDESRIAPVTTSGRNNVEGFYANQSRDSVSPGVYYPASDAGFVGLGHGNVGVQGQQILSVAGWVQRNLQPNVGGGVPGVTSPPGYCCNPSVGNRLGGNGSSDLASDEGGDDSVSGKKVKLMCSFGGKILPRPSDGALRYVGGQTRIISVRKDVSFSELVQKIADSYGCNVGIKYQLPEEDLDALVSVSCSDDLENMMEEYEKLVERSSDGSAKLRVFLFSASELDSSGVQMGDFQDNGQKYVEAVNGIGDVAIGGIMRKESIASATSTQNSDFSGNDAIEPTGHGQVDVFGVPSNGGLSPKNIFASPRETAPVLVNVDPKPAVYVEPYGAPVGIQLGQSHPPQTLSMHPVAVIPLQQQQPVGFPPQPPYMQSYADLQQESLNCTNYVQYPSQMGFPAQIMGTVGPTFTQQQYRDNVNVSPHQFVPAVHMTMGPPSSHASIKPNVVQPVVQIPQIRMECYPETYGQGVVQLPGDQSYSSYYAQHPPAVLGGHTWHPVSQPEQVPFSEGLVLTEKVPRFEECYMCQKALPHAHSDTIAQGQKEGSSTTSSDFNNPVYHSLQLEENTRGRPINVAAVTGSAGEIFAENQVVGRQARVLDRIDHEAIKPQHGGIVVPQNVERYFENDVTVLQSGGSPELPQVSLPQCGLAGGLQSPYSVFMGVVPQLYQETVIQKPLVPNHFQVKQDASTNKPVNVDNASASVMSLQTSDNLIRGSPNVYSGSPLFIPREGTVDTSLAYDQLKQIDGRMENLGLRPSEVLNNEQGVSPIDNAKKDVVDHRQQQLAGKEPYVDNTICKSNQQKEMFSCPSNEAPHALDLHPADSSEVAQQSLFVNPCHPQQRLPVDHLGPDHILYGNSTTFQGYDSTQVTQRNPLIGEWKDNSSQFQTNMACSGLEALHIGTNIPVSVSPVNRVGDMQDNSNSLFSSQDPWNLRHDTHFPPPRPNKILTRKEGNSTRDPFIDNCFANISESPTGNIVGLMTDLRTDYQPSGNSYTDYAVQSSKGSAEEHIKQELRAVAEGVAASVLQTSMPSVPDSSSHEKSGIAYEVNQDTNVHNTNVEVQHTEKSEGVKPKLPERTNLEFPVSDGIGRLQIISNGDLEELRELGSGTFGTVYHGKWRGTDVAIKRINDRCFTGKPSEQERMRDDFWNEAIKLADLHHPNVVAFYGVVLDGPGGSVATVTEYMVNGSLRTALQRNEKNLDKRKRLLIAMDVAFGMEYLHGKNIVHFDLKSDNLLVNLRDPHRPICKVGDLGLSKVKCKTLISGGVRGTLPWMAPELLNGSSSLVSEKVDVFSFSIVLWELLTGDEPYADLHYGAIIGGIVSNTLRPPVPESCDPEWRSLMERCWSADPSDRPNFTEIANQLRAMVTNLPARAQPQHQQPPSAQPQAKN